MSVVDQDNSNNPLHKHLFDTFQPNVASELLKRILTFIRNQNYDESLTLNRINRNVGYMLCDIDCCIFPKSQISGDFGDNGLSAALDDASVYFNKISERNKSLKKMCGLIYLEVQKDTETRKQVMLTYLDEHQKIRNQKRLEAGLPIFNLVPQDEAIKMTEDSSYQRPSVYAL